jgi:hypothetical protein
MFIDEYNAYINILRRCQTILSINMKDEFSNPYYYFAMDQARRDPLDEVPGFWGRFASLRVMPVKTPIAERRISDLQPNG